MQKSEIIAGLKEIHASHLAMATYTEQAISLLEKGAEGEYPCTTLPKTSKLVTNIGAVLREINVPTHIRGYKFIKDAVEAVIENPELIKALTKELYPLVAKKNETTPSRTERAIRHAIELAWNNYDCGEAMKKYFPAWPDGSKPTIGMFISTLAEVLGQEGA